uniref:Uncharacterized protein n=1 Tax=Rhizophagus irregularis (strain DAOM 181602 / DAOM 197198 / MUCL 43194) TaxID=747089 RepID=U9SXQ1_RHIID
MLISFDDAYEGVSSLQNIKESKQEEPLTKNEIKTNLRVLKTNLKNSKAPYTYHFRKYLKKKSASNLSWRVLLASQVICADSEMVRTLEVEAYNFFMDPAERMKTLHDKSWKESNEKLGKVTLDILNILRDIWKNSAFGPKLVKSQSEGTYMTNVIVPMIRASLKDLPIGKSGYISTAERQSIASKDRRGIGK